MPFSFTSSQQQDRVSQVGFGLALQIALLMLTLGCVSNAIADEATAKSPELEIQISEVQLNNQTGLDTINGLLILKLEVHNPSDQPVKLDINQFQVRCDEKMLPCHSGVRSPLIGVPRSINAGESIDGYIAVNLILASGKEPVMELIWTLDERKTVTPVNSAIRNCTNLKTRLVGPQDCLAVIEIHRAVDNFSVWQLSEEFQRLQRAGMRRVVLSIKTDDTTQPSYQTRLAVSGWLGSAQEGYQSRRFGVGVRVNSPVQFAEFFVVGMGSRDPSGYSSGTVNIYRSSTEEAIASALQSTYETIPLDQAIADFDSEEPGVLLAAVEANIDRMQETQLQTLLTNATSRPAAYQAMIAGSLYRIASPVGVSYLAEFVRSENAEVSQAALRSLLKSVSPKAATTLKELWHETDDFDLRQKIVNEVMNARDYRHADLLEQYARALITQSSGPQPESPSPPPKGEVEKSTPFGSPTETPFGSSSPTGRTPQTPGARTFRNVLDFLKELDSNGVVEVANRELLNITDSDIQDVLLDFLLKTSPSGDINKLAHGYITIRLQRNQSPGELSPEQQAALHQQYGPKGTTRNLRITSVLMSTIRQFPNSAYTERLLELSEDPSISSTMRRSAFQVAARCATDQQLNVLIDDFEKLDRYGKEYLLKSMSALNHPRWINLAKECMKMDESTQGLAIGSLVIDGSAEAMLVLGDRLAELVQEAIDEAQDAPAEATNLSSRMLRPIEKLITGLRDCNLPEVRRIINRCERAPILKLNELAVNAARSSFPANPNAMALAAASRLNLAKDYEAALSAYNDILEADPFCAMAYSSRSSMHSRLGNPQAALADLQKAVELEPEDVLIESLIALGEVEIGRIQKGIEMMEATLKSVPDLPTHTRRDALYNLGCAYGRALETEKDPTLRQKYTVRGMEVLRDCVMRKNGWDDLTHVANDPDVDAFRTHPEWDELLDRMKLNAKTSRLRP